MARFPGPRSRYGLKQAGRQWFRLFFTILKDYRCEQSIYDPCVFTWYGKEGFIKMACHVDDVLLISSSKRVRDDFIRYFKTKVKEVKIFEDDITYLRVSIQRDRPHRKIFYHRRFMLIKC